MADDHMNDPDGMNAYFDSIPPETEAPNVVPFKRGSKADVRPDLPTIKLDAGELHNIASAAEDALIKADAPFYVRGSMLVRPVIDDLPASDNSRTKAARLAEVKHATMIDHLSRAANWIKFDGRAKAYVTADPKADVASIILARDGEWRLAPLDGVITTPTLRPDGTILAKAGYDRATRLLLIDPPKMPAIPDRPDKTDAEAALYLLDGLLDEFPFVDEASRSVALSALITPIVRGGMAVAPMHAMTAPTPGTGKSYIIDLASTISSGERAPVVAAAADDRNGETEKRLIACVVSGQTFISLDNVNGSLGGDFLCQLIERPTVSVRELGTGRILKVNPRAVCFANGNNIHLLGDMTRRALLCSLDAGMERPETREFAHDPREQILADRGKYVAAALTIVRAYIVAGSPDRCKPLASFEAWSNMVRSAIVWLGRPDPCETMERARADDPVTSKLTALLVAWHAALGEEARTTGAVIDKAIQTNPHGSFVNSELREALLDVAADNRGNLGTLKLAHYLRKYQGRVMSQLKIASEDAVGSTQKVWKVIEA